MTVMVEKNSKFKISENVCFKYLVNGDVKMFKGKIKDIIYHFGFVYDIENENVKDEYGKTYVREQFVYTPKAVEKMTDKEYVTTVGIMALKTIKDICNSTPRCSKCQFSIGLVCLISQENTIPRDWKIGNFENGKLLR